jgi:hypothetical protein
MRIEKMDGRVLVSFKNGAKWFLAQVKIDGEWLNKGEFLEKGKARRRVKYWQKHYHDGELVECEVVDVEEVYRQQQSKKRGGYQPTTSQLSEPPNCGSSVRIETEVTQ